MEVLQIIQVNHYEVCINFSHNNYCQ